MHGGGGFSNLLGPTLLLNEVTETEPPPLAMLLSCGNARLTVQRLPNERLDLSDLSVEYKRGSGSQSDFKGAERCCRFSLRSAFVKHCVLIFALRK